MTIFFKYEKLIKVVEGKTIDVIKLRILELEQKLMALIKIFIKYKDNSVVI